MRSEISEEFTASIKEVWDIVTNNNDYNWRSDIKKVEILDHGDAFIEYSNDNVKTTCYVTKKIKYEVYEFNIENKNLYGNFKGEFFETENGGTKVIFTENIQVRNPVMRFISKFAFNLKKIQQQYINDLKVKLNENS